MNSQPRPAIIVSRRVLAFLSAALLLPWLALLALLWRMPAAATPDKSATAAGTHRPGAVDLPPGAIAAKPGPWGELIYNRILIEPPEALLPPPVVITTTPTWTFRDTDAAKLQLWLSQLPLDDAQRKELLAIERWEIRPGSIRLHPTAGLIASLSPETRAQLYTELGNFEENNEQAAPFRFRADAAEEWFRDAELRPETVTLVKKFLYRRGTSLIFSDLSTVLAQIPTQLERTQLIKTLSRKSTLMVRLVIRADADLDALESYWSRGQRSRDIRPLLASLVRKDSANTIDIIHLLPRGPRQLLYTYPLPDEKGRASFIDCHWTSLNFFNVTPDTRFENIDEVRRTYLEDFFLVTGRPTLGDVIVFSKRDNVVVHACVYIADNIVYTKNGAQPNAPWILMNLPDVIAFYPTDEPLDIQYYRSKRVAAP